MNFKNKTKMIKYYKTIAFTNAFLNIGFRYDNKFQILPLSTDNKPYCPYASHYPFFLEYTIEYQKEEPKDTNELLQCRINKEKEILNLLSCLTNYRFFQYTPSNNVWGIQMPNKKVEEMNEDELKTMDNQNSIYVLALYIYQGLKNDLNIDNFSNYTFNHAVYKDNTRHKYYTDNPIDNNLHFLTIPNTLNESLQVYYNLSPKTKQKVNSCIYLACDGMDISNYKRSLSFLSFVAAIEGLVNLECDDDEIQFECHNCQTIKESPYHCPNCGRPIWGIKQKFINFLSKFVMNSEKSQKKYKDIYNLRSKLTHTGKLFVGDYDLSLDNNVDSQEYNDWLMRLETLQLFRIALDSWLRYKDKTIR